MENEIVVENKSNVSSPSEMIKVAIAQGVDLDKLEKLLTLQERWDANEARKSYHEAMASFKANPPDIDKDKEVSFKTQSGQTTYSHATLYNVTTKINVELSKHGLSASWTTQQNGMISVTCRITHKRGHSEETTLSAQADVSGSKNSIQAIGSTITYLERYTLLALTGLATHDQDDDSASSEKSEKIDDSQMHKIRDLLILAEGNEAKFLAYMGIAKLEDMPKADYPKAVIALEDSRKKKEAKGKDQVKK